MRATQRLIVAVLLGLVALAATAQEQKPAYGAVEFGVRQAWGDVYGRPDLPFQPSIFTSKYNEYRDVRNGFFVRRFRLNVPGFLGSDNYVDFQADKAIYRDQSYLATFGGYNRFKVQLRYDEIPHIFSNTARTPYAQTAPGVFTLPAFLRSSLQAINNSTALPSTIQTQIVPNLQFIVPQLVRRSGSGLLSWDATPDWNLSAYFWREHQTGSRPLGTVINSSPSASLTGGYGVELPEPINYFNNLFRLSTEYGRSDWAVQAGYTGSFFENNIDAMVFDNPFRVTDCVQPNGCISATQGPAIGRYDLYPNNRAQYLNFAGAFDLTKFVRVMAAINPGWLRQDDRLLPYTSNALLLAQSGPLPATRTDGKKQTLAMNYTAATRFWKGIEFKAAYRQYDYNNDTPMRDFVSIQGDIAAPGEVHENKPFAFDRKNVELTGNWFFARKSSLKLGYEGEWMDREHRDVEHSIEHGFLSALDLNPTPTFNFRASYRRSDRTPEHYEDELSLETERGLPEIHPLSRRFDEAKRTRNRANLQAQYSLTDRLDFGAFAESTQDDYNQRGGVNSASALNFISGTTSPYYLYGLLKDLSWDYGLDFTFAASPAASFFGEYSFERYHKRMTSRYRVPGSIATGTLPPDCSVSGRACDSANNDWESTAREIVNIFTLGTDLYLSKKVYFTTYYSLSAAKGNVDSHPLGDPTITTGPNRFLLTTTNAAVPYPETTHRSHEVTAIFKYKLTDRLMPKLEYRYSQFDNRDYQTTAMTPYMGCVSALPPATAVPGCTSPLLGTPSPFYPFFVVGDTSAARHLFLGADQPSFRSHYLAATVELHF